MFPLLFPFLYFVINPWTGGSGNSLGFGILVLFVTGPLALAWLLGLPFGMLFRGGRAPILGATSLVFAVFLFFFTFLMPTGQPPLR
jgi:hypothetical protein